MAAGVAGVLLDGQWGLIIHAPVYLAAIAGLWTLAARRTGTLAALALILPYCAAVALYRQWWGEWCPPARYLAPVAPLAAMPLAALAARAGRRGVLLAAFLAVPGVAVTLLYGADPHLMFQHPTRESVVVLAIAQFAGAPDGATWAAWLPSFVPRYDYLGVGETPLGRNLAWVTGVLVVGTGFGWRIASEPDELRSPK
jgi:hypothetical protein